MFPYAEVLAAPLIKIVGDVMNRVLPPEKMGEADRANLNAEMAKALLTADYNEVGSQLQINLEEAKSESRFVSGWRPFIGWVCGGAFAYHMVLRDFFTWIVVVAGRDVPPLPVLDHAGLTTVLLGMLGIGGLRTFEKFNGVNMNRDNRPTP